MVLLETVALLAVAGALIWLGIIVREQVWLHTEALRYVPDMNNGWNWGSRAAKEGYFGLYDRVVAEKNPDHLELDYAPLRLATMTLWARSQLTASPPPTEWQRGYGFNAPLLYFNTTMELIACLGLFALARDWSRRDDLSRGHRRRWLRAEWLALAATMLLWFNPAVLLSAHARITWDVWILTFYIWAIYFGGRGWWFTAGCIIALGAMFKAQLLIMMPLLLIWLIMRCQFIRLLRFVIGFAVTAGLIVSPWIIGPRAGPIAFVLAVTSLPVFTWALLRRWPVRERSMPAWWLRWQIPFMAAAAMWLCVPLFHGSMSWYTVAVTYGSSKFKDIETGGASSLAGILKMQYQWSADGPVGSLKWFTQSVTISQLLITCFTLLMLPCGWALARYAKAGDKRFVLAAAAPWLIYFAIFPKMHERYLLWGAGVACASTIVGMGPVWLALLFTLLQTVMSLFQMLKPDRPGDFLTEISPTAGQTVYDIIHPTFPGIGWAMMLGAAVWVWMTIGGAIEVVTRRRSASGSMPPRER